MQSSLLDLVTAQLGGNNLERVSRQLGTDQGTAGQAIQAALPVLIGALARNASTPGGAGALAAALERDHDGSILDDPAAAVTNYQSGPGAGILTHVLGDRRPAVEEGLARTTGLDRSKVGSLLQMAAPILLGALGGVKRQGGLDAGALAAMLGRERERATTGSAGSLLGLLDRDGDGNIVDDLGRMAGKLFKR